MGLLARIDKDLRKTFKDPSGFLKPFTVINKDLFGTIKDPQRSSNTLKGSLKILEDTGEKL